tara:strand:+ start:31895 stop:32764 length:870 start_codon:yes stop_codon:yes gene_type:complete
MNKNFGLMGVAGFIAPKHLEAISATKNNLLISLDPHDSVGVLDKFFPESLFFKNEKDFIKSPLLKKLDFISVCTPNYLHKSHIHLALSNNINCICEKPLVLNLDELYDLIKWEEKYKRRVYPILQLRLDPEIISFKKEVEDNPTKFYDIDLNYVTTRGDWYFKSWKGDDSLSGGILMNIGVHFFDILCWVFGEVTNYTVDIQTDSTWSGHLEFKNAKIKWLLSIDSEYLPKSYPNKVYKIMTINNKSKIKFSVSNLHTKMYDKILEGNGFTLSDILPTIILIDKIKNKK